MKNVAGQLVRECYVVLHPSLIGAKAEPTIYLSYPELPESYGPEPQILEFPNVFDAKNYLQGALLPDERISVAA